MLGWACEEGISFKKEKEKKEIRRRKKEIKIKNKKIRRIHVVQVYPLFYLDFIICVL